MAKLNLGPVMDAIAATLVAQSVTAASSTFAWPVPSFTPPCTIVGYPRAGQIVFDMTFKRGADEATFPVWFVAGRVIELSARATLTTILGGATDIKTALESGGGTLGGVVSSTRVIDCVIEPLLSVSDNQEYIAARFDVQVIT